MTKYMYYSKHKKRTLNITMFSNYFSYIPIPLLNYYF